MNHAKPIETDVKPANSKLSGSQFPIAFAEALDLSVHDSISGLRKDWKAAEKQADISVYQRYEWVEAYLEAQREQGDIRPFIIVGRLEGEIVFILPLVLKGKYVSRLKFIGGTHVNFNMGIFPRAYREVITPETFKKIFARIRKLTPGLGYLALCCQPESWGGAGNPLMCEPHQRSANPAFFLNLEGGFDATLSRGNAKRKRKKFRQQCRQADALGGYSLIKPQTSEEISYLIDVFLEQKSRRLKALGIKDVFADDSVRSFLSELAVRSLGRKQPLLQLYGLRLGDDIAAVFGAGASGKHLSGYFSSIDSEKYGAISPGEMLLYLVVWEACEEGFQSMDLGAGDERYKRSWCSEVVEMYEIIMPYNIFGMPVVWMRRCYGLLRRSIRENDRSWALYKRLRQLKAKFT